MRDYSKLFKRVQAWVLAVAMILPVLSGALILPASAADENQKPLTEGQIVADNYDLTKAEKNLLASGLLVGDTHLVYVPGAGDGLISAEGKTITAKSYKKGGYTWNPVSANVYVLEGGVETLKETVDFVGETATCKNEYAQGFYADVLYRVEIEVPVETQKALLNASAYLKQAFDNMDLLNTNSGLLGKVEALLPVLKYFADGINVPLGSASISAKFSDAGTEATYALLDQIDANGTLDLSGLVSAYASASNATKFIVETDVRDTFKATYANLKAISEEKIMNNTIVDDYFSDMLGDAWASFKNDLRGWLDGTAAAYDDAWSLESTQVIKSDITNAHWPILDRLVKTVCKGEPTVVSEIKNPLVADETTIRFAKEMYNVTVEVALDFAGAETFETVITLPARVSAADVLNAIKASGIEAAAIAAWTDKGSYVDGKFTRSATELALDFSLTDNLNYSITYSPISFKITSNYADEIYVPYGSVVELPVSTVVGFVYGYEVNGADYYQGEKFVVAGDTNIVRTAYDYHGTLNEVVCDVYLDGNNKASAILGSGALNVGNELILIRTPDESCVTVENGLLSAKVDCDSAYAGMWIVDGYKLVDTYGNTIKTGVFENGEAVLPAATDYDRIVVTYSLALPYADAEVLQLLDLAGKLSQEAADQTSVLDRLATHSGNMGMIGMIGLVDSVLDKVVLNKDALKNAQIKKDFRDAIQGIQDNCMTGNVLNLKTLIDAYKAEGLGYYYKNYEAFSEELSKLSGYLTLMVGGANKADKAAALTILINELATMAGDVASGLVGKEDVILELESEMAESLAKLTPPDAAINLNSDKLDELTAALVSAGTVDRYNALPGKFVLTEEFSLLAPTKGAVVVDITYGGQTETLSWVYDLDYVLKTDDVATIVKDVEARIESLGLNGYFYTNGTYDKKALTDLVGATITGTKKVDFAWDVKQFTVVVPGMSNQTVSIEGMTIKLAGTSDANIEYKYSIEGYETIKVGSNGTNFTFAANDLVNLFKDGSYTVGRVVLDVKEQKLIAFVNEMNASIDNGAVKFVLVKNNGEYAIVMKMDGTQPNAMANAMQGMAMGFVKSGYAYIGLGGNGVLENNKISLQAIIDTIMYSGFTSDDLIKAVNGNGSVNHMTLKGDALVGDMNKLGGKLIVSTMNVGDNAASSQKLDFYITLGSAAGEVLEIRNLFAEQLSGYLKIVCANGKSTLQLTVPEKAYEAYLAVLLATGNLDIRNLNAIDASIAMGYVKNFVDPLFTGDVSLATVANTLKEFGYNVNFSEYERVFDKICEQYGRTEIVYDEKTGTITRTFSIKPILNAVNVPDVLAGVIKEYETGITVSGAASLENLDKHYEALFVDVNAAGATNKIGLTSNLAAKLPTLAGTSIVVLLDDVNGNLVFSKTTVLNLNGFTVNGSITGNGNLTIVDSAMTADGGAVKGTVSGNVTILGGEYATDVSKFLKEGYAQVDGKVGNEFYAFVEDKDGNITIEIDAGLIKTNSLPDVKFMVLDLAVELFFNGYTTNKLLINGNKVFDISMDDFVGLYAGDDKLNTLVHNIVDMVDAADLAAIITDFMSDMNDYAALQAAVLNNEPLLAYELTTGAWKLELQHITDGDYLSIGVGSGNEKTRNLYVKIVGSEADKQHVADVLGALKDTTDVEIKVEANQGFDKSDDKNLILDLNAFATVDVNFSNNYDYAVMFSILLADGLAGSEASAKLVNGIRTYYETGSIAALRAAFDAVTTSQVITAAKNFARNDSITAMVQDLGIADVVADSVIDLEKLLDRYGKGAAMVLRKIDRLQGGDRTLGSFYNETLGGYGFVRTDLDKTFARKLFKGYGLTLNMAVSEIRVCINLFGDTEIVEDAPVIEDVVVDVTHEDIAGVKIDGKFMYLDAHSNGLSADDLLGAMGFVVTNGQIVNVEINTVGRVATGSVITITAQNPVTGDTATMVLTVIVLGDVDCDGRATVKDATIMADYFVYGLDLNEYQILALDADWSGSFNVKDALVLSDKFVYWDSYTSKLGA